MLPAYAGKSCIELGVMIFYSIYLGCGKCYEEKLLFYGFSEPKSKVNKVNGIE